MATYSGQVPTDSAFVALRDSLRGTVLATSTTTYYFRRADGTRGSTTDLATVPAGAVIERSATQ